MEEQILDIKNLFSHGINLELFEKLILHSTDGTNKRHSAYQNDLNIDGWTASPRYRVCILKMNYTNV